MAGTVMPSPVFYGTDSNGNPLNGGKLETYIAGTTTPLATYTDAALTTPHANPVILNSAGRATIYLSAASYKFVLKDSAGNTIYTVDNVSATTTFGSASDVTGVAGENLLARDVVILSDGSADAGGAGAAGKWMKADADFRIGSARALVVGVVPAAINSGASGTVRVLGVVPGFSGLTPGAAYFIGATNGTLVTTAPFNRRLVGAAISATELLVAPESMDQGQGYWDLPVYFGGSHNEGISYTSYPVGGSYSQCIPGALDQTFAMSRLPPGVYHFEAMLGVSNAAATVSAAIYSLTDDTALTGAEISSNNSGGILTRSTAFSINHADTTVRAWSVKGKISNSAHSGFIWGARLMRVPQ